MKTVSWILGALGAVALATPTAAMAKGADDKKHKGAETNIESNGDADLSVEGDGGDAAIEGDGDATVEGEGEGVLIEEETVTEGDGEAWPADDTTGLEGDGSSTTGEESRGLEGDGSDTEGNGDLFPAEDQPATEGDGGAYLEEEGVFLEGDGSAFEEDAAAAEEDVTVEGEGSAYDYQAARTRAEKERKGPDKGVDVQAQGGIISFPGEAASQLTPGALYGVVVGIEPPIPVFELELGYQGGAYQTDQRLTGAQENVIENGGQVLLMASPEIGTFEPYAFGGYQLSWFNVYERPNSTGAVQDDTLSKVPVGAGFDVHLGDVVLGARGSYNFVFSNDAFTNIPTDSGDRSADQVSGSVLLGGQF